MASISTRSSVLAIKVETTEGTPVAPTAASDYVALQDDFSMSPNFDTLENAELKSSIGKGKPILGAENPSASLTHYLRHSGQEGIAPNYKMLLKGAFGEETVASTEYDTVAASTVSAVNVDTGEGANYARGQALLVKDGTNGYAIRPVKTVAGDVLTPGFDLPAAPASGVNLGKAVTYSPADAGHQAMSVWHYLGNSGAKQLMAGAKVTDTSITFTAGQLIAASFSLEGLAYYFNPVEITASTNKIDVTDDAGTAAATVAVGMYKDPHDLASAMETALNTASSETYTCTYSDVTGRYTIASTTSAVVSVLWNTGANTANSIASKVGFSTAADSTGALTYTSATAQSFAAPQSASYDDSDPLAAKANEVLLGDADDTTSFSAQSISFTLSTPKRVIESVTAASGRSGSIVAERSVTISISGLLEKYDSDKFRRFRTNAETGFCYNFGTKTGGNWVAGKCGALYVPTATVTSFNVTDADGLAQVEIELQAYVNASGEGEVYLSFV